MKLAFFSSRVASFIVVLNPVLLRLIHPKYHAVLLRLIHPKHHADITGGRRLGDLGRGCFAPRNKLVIYSSVTNRV